MTTRYRTAMLAALAVLTIAAPALAQDGSDAATKRTPASAQKFLEMVAPATIRYYTKEYTEVSLAVRSVSSSEACMTNFEVEQNGQVANVVIDWTKVQAVTRDEKTNLIGVTSAALDPVRFPYKYVNVAFLTMESIGRGFAAMQFLRTACDKAAETGF